MTIETDADEIGIIGEYDEDGYPIIVSFENEMPAAEVRERQSWLTVVSWKYDGSSRNGMPHSDLNTKMIELENALLDNVVSAENCTHVYNRTGNGLKEFVFYIASQDAYLKCLNDALADHPDYPIEIKFYEDSQWEDFQKLLDMFRGKE